MITALDGSSFAEKKNLHDNLLKDSQLTEADVEEIGEKIKQGIFDRVVSKRV
ncbi:MAG: hypothetical protein GYA24_11745 [Candidatus Lokiarchaeota archaeon]|nr:hypothetical protein [Candidatus Lokiarchaeota archaeon]